MRVTQTLVATGPDGQDLGDLVTPVEIKWCESDNPAKILAAIANIIADNEDRKFTKTIAINVEL